MKLFNNFPKIYIENWKLKYDLGFLPLASFIQCTMHNIMFVNFVNVFDVFKIWFLYGVFDSIWVENQHKCMCQKTNSLTGIQSHYCWITLNQMNEMQSANLAEMSYIVCSVWNFAGYHLYNTAIFWTYCDMQDIVSVTIVHRKLSNKANVRCIGTTLFDMTIL